jgi:mannose-6-phosphate isomerase
LINPYPLVFEPILLEKVWGGRRLEGLGKKLAAGKSIGESWELADLSATSASGAGGQAARSVIANGPLSG